MMKIYAFLLITVISFSVTIAQPFKLGKTAKTFIDPSRSNRKIPSIIYYPATATGSNQPIVNNGQKFPVISFGHGFVMKSSDYKYLADALVPLGYIVIFPSTEQGVPPNHNNFGLDEAFTAKEMVNWGNNTSNFFYGVVADKKAIGGHSMGGGASFLGAKYNPDLDAFFNLSAAETFINESAIIAAKRINIPALVITGTDDHVAPPTTNSRKMFNFLNSDCKTFVNIDNATHCQFSNVAGVCALGEVSANLGHNVNPISRSLQHQITLSVLIPWLNFHLKGDCNAANQFENVLLASSGFTYVDSCTTPCSSARLPSNNAEISSQKIKIFPNPTSDIAILLLPNSNTDKSVQVFSIDGKMIYDKIVPQNQYQLDLEVKLWEKGMYLTRISYDNEVQSVPLVVE